MTVAQAVPVLRKLGITPVWRTNDNSDTPDGVSETTIENQFIESADPRSLSTAFIWVQTSPPPPSAEYDLLSRGC